MKEYKITTKTYKNAYLEDYQREILRIWPQLEVRPALHTWARVVQHATTACEGMRRTNWALVLEEIAKTIVWWLAFIEKLNLLKKMTHACDFNDDLIFGLPISATTLVWMKYPDVCPVEFGLAVSRAQDVTWKKRPAQYCTCLARKKTVEERSASEKTHAKEVLREFALRNKRHCPKGIDALEGMFRRVYAGSIYQLSVQELFLHLIEEIGEVSEALADATTSKCLRNRKPNRSRLIEERRKKLRGIAEELADVFSWSVGIVAKVQAILISFENYFDTRHRHGAQELRAIRQFLKGSKHISLAEVIWQKCGGMEHKELRCWDCQERICKCIEQREQPLYEAALDERQQRQLLSVTKKISLD